MKITLKDGTILEDVTTEEAVTVLSKSVQEKSVKKENVQKESLRGKSAPYRPGARRFSYTITGVRIGKGKTIVTCGTCSDKLRQAQIGKHYRRYHAEIAATRQNFPYTKLINSDEVTCDICSKEFQHKSVYGHIKVEHPNWREEKNKSRGDTNAIDLPW